MIRLALIALAAGCYSPDIADGQFSCAGDTPCPSGFVCSCGACRKQALSSCAPDMSAGGADGGLDMAVSAEACANGGMRSAGDPGLAKVAACPAAWQLPGLGTSPMCGRQPTANGKNATGTSCAASDNCAAGWHICNDLAELGKDGFGTAECTTLSGQIGLWLMKEPIAPGMPDGGGGMPGPAMCGTPESHLALGCGSLGKSPDATNCLPLNKMLADMPEDGKDECETTTDQAFICGVAGSGISAFGQFEYTTVYKPTLDKGGVLCCAD